ncbi:MAG: YhcH/YjgK/YiaL family protein [Deltaproteobacteria bacterium]
MIVDHLSHWKKYFTHPVWETVFGELMVLDENTPEMEKKIRGDDVILKVFSYDTVDPQDEQAVFESHRRYLDIHTSIIHAERIDWSPAASLKVVSPYNESADEICYAGPRAASASLVMVPGLFVLFSPHDAHRPRLCAPCESRFVKKAVMKILIDMPL